VEHLFFPVPRRGEYELWVRQVDGLPFPGDGQDYAVAWWAASVVPEPSTWALVVVGTACLLGQAWRRRAQSKGCAARVSGATGLR
jgi:hypothetical protein